jgi:hypothetical protein
MRDKLSVLKICENWVYLSVVRAGKNASFFENYPRTLCVSGGNFQNPDDMCRDQAVSVTTLRA